MAEASVPALRAGLADKESSVRIHCAWALWRINKDPLVVSVLKKDFRDVNNLARFDAAKVLWEVEKDPAVLPMLKESLHHNDLTSKLCAVLCVRDIGPSARELKGEVRLLLKDPDENIRRAAEEAIKAIE
jgi:HEAT repeat protein